MDLDKEWNRAQFRQDCEVVIADGYRTDEERRLAATALELLGQLERRDATYKRPNEGWVCFHCGERFITYESAKEHFGEKPYAENAALREQGKEEIAQRE